MEPQEGVFRRAPEAALNLSTRVMQNRIRKMMKGKNGLIVAKHLGKENPFLVILDLKPTSETPHEEALRNAVSMWPELGDGFVFRAKTGGPSLIQKNNVLISQNWIVYPVSRYGADVVDAYVNGRYDPELIGKARFEPITVYFTGRGMGISGDVTYLKKDLIEAGCKEKKLFHPRSGKKFTGLWFRGGDAHKVREVLKKNPSYNAVIWF